MDNKIQTKHSGELLTFFQKIDKYKSCTSIKEAISRKDLYSLAQYSVKYGKKNIYTYLLACLKTLNEYIGSSMSEFILSDLSQFIYRKVYFYNLMEVATLFNWLKEQQYYTKSANEILVHINSFLNLRMDEAEKISTQEHEDHKKLLPDEVVTKRIQNIWYERVKKEGIVPDVNDEKLKDKESFQKFKAEYERGKMVE